MPKSNLIRLGWKKRLLTFLLSFLVLPLRLFNVIFVRAPRTERTLVLEPFGLGDVISLEPMVRGLRRRGEVLICAKSSWRSLYPDVQWIDASVPWSSYDPDQKYSFRQYLSTDFRTFLEKLRQQAKGSIGIDSRGDIRSILLLYLAGCRKVLTLSHYLGSNLQNPRWVGQVLPFRENLRRWENNAEFARCLEPAASELEGPRFAHLKSSRPVSGAKVAGFVPVAPWEGKLWDKWALLAERLQTEGWDIRVLCGPGQTLAAAQATGQSPSIVIECGSIPEWARELARLKALISLDSGPMHLADALEVPVLALFGQGILPLWAPSGHKSRVVSHQSDPDFRQCHPLPENAPFARQFMNRITVDEVIATLQEITQD